MLSIRRKMVTAVMGTRDDRSRRDRSRTRPGNWLPFYAASLAWSRRMRRHQGR